MKRAYHPPPTTLFPSRTRWKTPPLWEKRTIPGSRRAIRSLYYLTFQQTVLFNLMKIIKKKAFEWINMIKTNVLFLLCLICTVKVLNLVLGYLKQEIIGDIFFFLAEACFPSINMATSLHVVDLVNWLTTAFGRLRYKFKSRFRWEKGAREERNPSCSPSICLTTASPRSRKDWLVWLSILADFILLTTGQFGSNDTKSSDS